MNWIFFAILASAVFGLANVLEKIISTKYLKDPIIFASIWGFIFPPLFILTLIQKTPYPGLLETIIALGFGVVVTFAGMLLYYAMQREEVSRVMPLWQASSILVIFTALVFSGEQLTFFQVLAFFLVFAGSFLLSIKKTEVFYKITPIIGVIFLGGTIVAFSKAALKIAAINSHPLAILTLIFLGHFLVIVGFWPWKSYRKRFIKSLITLKPISWLFILGAFIFIMLGELFFILAVSQGPSSLVVMLSRMSGVFILIYATLGSFWFPKLIKENTTGYVVRKKIIAVGCIFAGIVLLHL